MAATASSSVELETTGTRNSITVKAVDKRSILELLSDVDIGHFHGCDLERKEFLHAARALVRRLETPRETLFEMGTSYPLMYSSLRVCQRLRVFEKLGQGGSPPKSTSQLCDGSPADPSMLRRHLRHLAAMHILIQIDEDHWAPTRMTEELRCAEYTSFVDMSAMLWFKLVLSIPEWLDKNEYRDSHSANDCAWMEVGSRPFFEAVKDDPEQLASFTSFHRAHRRDVPQWVDTCPSHDMIADAEQQGPIIVEQGSSNVGDLSQFLTRHPQSAGRLIFQGPASQIEEVRPALPTGVMAMAHDLFEPQPVVAAKVYFMHDVLHYWSDDACRSILGNLKPALKRGYSRLVLVEMVLTAPATDRYKSSRDLIKCHAFGSKDRTAGDWRRLLGTAGFEITNIHGVSLDESVIEAVLA